MNNQAGKHMQNNHFKNNNKSKFPDRKFEVLSSDNYVKIAETAIQDIKSANKDERKIVTTTQIRNILALTIDIYNEVALIRETGSSAQLPDEVIQKINYLKLRILYEAGRTPAVKDLVEASKLLEHINYVLKEENKKKKDYILFTRYMEALVAYRKYLVAKDE